MRPIPKVGEWASTWLIRAMVVLAVVSTVAVGLYYVSDRYWRSSESLAGHESDRLEELVREDPQNPGARVSLGSAYLASDRYDEAIAQFEQAIELVPDYRDALVGLAFAYMGKGSDAEAIDYFNRVLEVTPEGSMASTDRVQETVLYYLGKIYLEQGQIDEAVEHLTRAVNLDRGDADALLLLGSAFRAQGEYDDAESAFKTALTYVPDFIEAYEGLEETYQADGELERARYARSMVALFSGDPEGAVAGLESVSAEVKDDADIFWGLGLAYERVGDDASALEAYRQAVSINEGHLLAEDALQRLEGTP